MIQCLCKGGGGQIVFWKTKGKILYSDNGQMKAGVCLSGSYETFDPAAIRRSEKRNL